MANEKPHDLGSIEPDSITLDFQPDEKEFGRLRSEKGPEFLIAMPSPYKSPFQYTIRRAVEVHGFGKFHEETVPATLLMFDVGLRTEALSKSRRIRKVKIEMEFKSKDAEDSDSAVEVIDIAPGNPAVWFFHSVEKQEGGHEINCTGGLNIHCAAATGSWTIKKTYTKEMNFWASIEASSMPSAGNGIANYVKWVFKENPSQESEVPTDATLVVLLRRGKEGFLCEAKIELEVDWVTKLRYGFAMFHHWRAQGKLSFSRVGDGPGAVEKRSNGKHKIPAVDNNHLEKVIEDKEGLDKFVEIYMPEL